jgi:hypothetical protein
LRGSFSKERKEAVLSLDSLGERQQVLSQAPTEFPVLLDLRSLRACRTYPVEEDHHTFGQCGSEEHHYSEFNNKTYSIRSKVASAEALVGSGA